MSIYPIQHNNNSLLEIVSDDIVLSKTQDILDLIGEGYAYDSKCLIIYEKNIAPEFFDLKTKIAGDILQKISTYEFQIIIIGEFDKYESQSLKDFIYESNKGKTIYFLNSLEETLSLFSI
jgi:hypothetical protein